MSLRDQITFGAVGVQYVYATLEELLAGAERLQLAAKREWHLRSVNSKGVDETVRVVRDQLSAIAVHLDVAEKVLQAEDREMEQAAAEIERLLGEL